jgi:hypothetical protein
VIYVVASCAVAVVAIFFGIRYRLRSIAATRKRWADNLALVHGTAGWGLKWSGVYGDRPVSWRIFSTGGGDSGNDPVYWHYELKMSAAGGGADWHIGPANRQQGGDRWILTSDSPAVADRFRRDDIEALIDSLKLSYAQLRYDGRKSIVTLKFDLTSENYVPDRATFENQLAALAELSALHDSVDSTLEDADLIYQAPAV